jgi:hypothetical protein
MNTLILSLIGIAAILDVILIFYIGPKTLSPENGSPFIWIPFSFFRKVFIFLTMFYLIHTNQSDWLINSLSIICVFGLYWVVKGWGFELENPWTTYKMDKINIREGHFSPVNPWTWEGCHLFTDSFADRVFYAAIIITQVVKLLHLL